MPLNRIPMDMVDGLTSNLADIVQHRFDLKKDYGAKGDGITDDTTAINNALTNVPDGAILKIPSGTYIYNSSISRVFNKGITIDAETDVLIDGSNSTALNLITLGGSIGSASPLLANISQYGTSLTTNLSLSAGDMVYIQSTDLWDSARSYYYKGEMVEVESVSGTTINLKTPLFDSYSATTTTISKLTMPKVIIRNLAIKRNSNQVGLHVLYARDICLDSIQITGARQASIQVGSVFGGIITNCYATDCWYSGTTQSYGLEIDSSQSLNVIGGRFLGGRHGITNGGTTPNRHIIIDGAFCSSKKGADAAGIDFHGNVEYATIKNCFCTGDSGINYAGTNGTIENNRLIGFSNSRPTLQLVTEIGLNGYLYISKNKINALSWNGLEIRPYGNSMTMRKIVVEDNVIDAYNIGFWISPTSTSQGISFVANEVELKNNTVTASNNDACIINNNSTVYMTIQMLKILGGLYTSQLTNDALSIALDTNSDIELSAKFVVSATNGTGIKVTQSRNLKLLDSHIVGLSTGSSTMILQCSGSLKVLECTIENFRNYGGLDCSGLLSSGSPIPTLLMLSNTQFINTTGNVRTDSTTKRIAYLADQGYAVAYGTAIPTTGTWGVGDRVVNSAPATGSPKSWVCTVAGTPGTWVSEGNL